MKETTYSVLIVEDEIQIRRFVRGALEDEDCTVYEAESGAQALHQTGVHQLDLVILDLGLPDTDGINVIRDLRNWSRVPIIILSARSSEDDKVAALDAGADDYLVKPFGVGELLARTRALLRRHSVANESIAPVVQFGAIRVDFSRRVVERDGETVHLTPIEYRLLSLLIANAGKVLTHRFLLREVWGANYVESNHYLRVFVGHLRRKLELDSARPRHILTETGIGYRMHLSACNSCKKIH